MAQITLSENESVHERGVTSRRVVRPEIQALRAIAVGLVVLYHLWPNQLTGGFVGVDVFLVISGFLITGHLVRGFAVSGELRLMDFYVRRMRRLLPASLLVLTVVALAVWAFVPLTMWGAVGWQLVASAFYFQNWALAAEAVDYLATGTNASPVQHYWSLSVEEQFYLFWPLLILGFIWLATRRARATVTGHLVAGVGLVTAASFAYSVYITAADPQAAYFVTPARVWEFGLGGLLALLLPTLDGMPVRLRAALSWAGLGAILGSAIAFTGGTPFPGSAALVPTLGAVAVIAAGSSDSALSPTKLFAWRPVQFVGDISYSVYLWHWPLIVLLPTVVFGPGGRLDTTLRVGIIVLSFALAWATKVHVEDLFRTSRRRTRIRRQFGPNVLAMASIIVAMVLIGGAGGSMAVVTTAKSETARIALERIQENTPECFGAVTVITGCTPTIEGVYPDPIIAAKDAELQGCQQRTNLATPIVCHYGSVSPDALKVVLVGDSHANQWTPTMKVLADQNGWNLTTYLKSGCGFNAAIDFSENCTEWNGEVTDLLVAGEFDLVVTANTSVTKFVGGYEGGVQGFLTSWQQVIGSGAKVVAIADTPRPGRGGLPHPPSCVEALDIAECNFKMEAAVAPDPKKEASEDFPGVSYVNLNSYMCPGGVCRSVIGNALVYRDNNHVTATWAKTLTPVLGEALESAANR